MLYLPHSVCFKAGAALQMAARSLPTSKKNLNSAMIPTLQRREICQDPSVIICQASVQSADAGHV